MPEEREVWEALHRIELSQAAASGQLAVVANTVEAMKASVEKDAQQTFRLMTERIAVIEENVSGQGLRIDQEIRDLQAGQKADHDRLIRYSGALGLLVVLSPFIASYVQGH